ncbi:MAG: hypothetical protein AAF738_11080, partial [Bacteroidota bacterium]
PNCAAGQILIGTGSGFGCLDTTSMSDNTVQNVNIIQDTILQIVLENDLVSNDVDMCSIFVNCNAYKELLEFRMYECADTLAGTGLQIGDAIDINSAGTATLAVFDGQNVPDRIIVKNYGNGQYLAAHCGCWEQNNINYTGGEDFYYFSDESGTNRGTGLNILNDSLEINLFEVQPDGRICVDIKAYLTNNNQLITQDFTPFRQVGTGTKSDTTTDDVYREGSVAIGSTSNAGSEKLYVDGNIRTDNQLLINTSNNILGGLSGIKINGLPGDVSVIQSDASTQRLFLEGGTGTTLSGPNGGAAMQLFGNRFSVSNHNLGSALFTCGSGDGTNRGRLYFHVGTSVGGQEAGGYNEHAVHRQRRSTFDQIGSLPFSWNPISNYVQRRTTSTGESEIMNSAGVITQLTSHDEYIVEKAKELKILSEKVNPRLHKIDISIDIYSQEMYVQLDSENILSCELRTGEYEFFNTKTGKTIETGQDDYLMKRLESTTIEGVGIN